MSFYAFMGQRFNYKDFTVFVTLALVLYHLKAKTSHQSRVYFTHIPAFTDPQAVTFFMINSYKSSYLF